VRARTPVTGKPSQRWPQVGALGQPEIAGCHLTHLSDSNLDVVVFEGHRDLLGNK
jgi:hypothetical protein